MAFLFQLLWTADSKTVVYPCQSTVVIMDTVSQKQRLFIGHTDKVCIICILFFMLSC